MNDTHIIRTGASCAVTKGEHTWIIDASWPVDTENLESLPAGGQGIYNNMLVHIHSDGATTTLHPAAVHAEPSLDIEKAIAAIEVGAHNLGEQHTVSVRDQNSVALRFGSGKGARLHTWEMLTQIETDPTG